MKHLIAAAVLAVLSAPAWADAINPFDPEGLSRANPSLKPYMTDYPFGGTPPYNRLNVDMALPSFDMRPARSLVASGGNTRSDVEISAATGSTSDESDASPWARDHNFIAPPQ